MLLTIAEARERIPGLLLPGPEAGLDDMPLAEYLHQVVAHCQRLQQGGRSTGARSFSFEIRPDGTAIARCFLRVTIGGAIA